MFFSGVHFPNRALYHGYTECTRLRAFEKPCAEHPHWQCQIVELFTELELSPFGYLFPTLLTRNPMRILAPCRFDRKDDPLPLIILSIREAVLVCTCNETKIPDTNFDFGRLQTFLG